MKYRPLICLCLFASMALSMQAALVENGTKDTLYVQISGERLDVYPPQLVASVTQTSKRLTIKTIDEVEHVYRLSLIQSVSTKAPENLPRFTSFKFNNKFNDQVFTDAEGEIIGDSLITASVVGIGKRLTPSFQLSDDSACVYVDSVRQFSKKSRLRFEDPVYYTVARPGWQVLQLKNTEQQDTAGTNPSTPATDEILTKVELTEDMLSTNAPSNYPNREGLGMLLDEDPSTFFHSTWGSGEYEKLPLDQNTYIDIDLPEALSTIQFSYTNRGTDGYYPLSLCLYASKDGKNWTKIQDFTVDDDGLPTEALGVYQSPTLYLGKSCYYLRLEQTQGAHKNYIAWAELAIYKVTKAEPVEPSPEPEPTPVDIEDISLQWAPYGRTYRVTVDWPTDRSVMTPSIYIDIENGEMVSSKDRYWNAVFSIDGAGVFPDMEETPVQIKGRGNSSWSGNAYAKNPYRLKFAEKVKPFGMTKGKSWVLQANKQSGSMMVNAIGMKAGHLMGAAATNHVIPVELYMNGDYRGSYIFNEKLGFANNSIDIEDESRAVRIELDSYGEKGQFRTDYYYLPVNIKEPDYYDETTSTELVKDDIINDFNNFVEAVYYNDDIPLWVDVDYLAAFLSANELVVNYELMHPKSTYLYKEDLFSMESKYVFGPIWDLDWGYGYEGTGSYCSSNAVDDFYNAPAHTFHGGSDGNRTELFWKNLRNGSEEVDRACYKVWTKFVTQGGFDELLEFCDDYFQYANPSFVHNATKWSDGNNYSSKVLRAKNWLKQRVQSIYSTLTPYDLTGELDETELWNSSEATIDNDDPEDPETGVKSLHAPTLFTVYDLRGVPLKHGATFNTWRDGLAPGLYLVNGKKVLVQ